MQGYGEHIMKTMKNLLLAVGMLAMSTTASAMTVNTDSYTGTFSNDNDVATQLIFMASSGTVTAQTFGYGGGTQADGNVVVAGGFDPILSLFNVGTGALIAQNDDAGGLVDPVTMAAFDSLIDGIFLLAGTYQLVLTQFSNFPSEPFGTFTDSGTTNYQDVTGDFRTADYAFDVTVSTVPVPAAGILFASALFGAGFIGRRKKKATQSNMIGAFTRTA